MGCKNCCNGHTWVSITGLSLSFFELILASIYNFHMIGFGLSIIGIITSGLYLHFAIRDKRELDSANSTNQALSPTSTDSNHNNLDDSNRGLVNNSNNGGNAQTGVSIMKAQQIQEESKKNNRWSRVLWIVYLCFIVFIGVLGIVRLISLFRRVKWRADLDDKFPDACGDWSVEHGCTRVTLEESGCVREKDIPSHNSLIFNISVDRLLNTQIEQCVDSLEGAKLMHPSDLSEDNDHGGLIHITFNSALFGFIDDMFMATFLY